MPSPQSSVPSDVEVLATANTKTKKPRVKSANWTEEETHEVHRRRQNLVSCGEFHKEKKSNSGTISILCIKKGVQKARECYSR